MSETTTKRSPLLVGHLADIHLQEMQYASTARGEAFFEAFKKAILLYHDQKVDLLVCAGDMFDTSRLLTRQCQQLLEIHALLQKLGIPMLCVDGNHDYAEPSWLDTLVPVPSMHSGIIPITNRSATIGGWKFAGWPALYADQYLDPTVQKGLDHDADVIIFHALVEGVVEAYLGKKKKIDISDLPTGGRIKAILLGDIHVPGYKQINGTLIGYPGSIEMCRITEPKDKVLHTLELSESGMKVVKTVPFLNSTMLRLQIRTEEDMEQALLMVTNYNGALIYVQFSPDITNCASRLMAASAADNTFVWSATIHEDLSPAWEATSDWAPDDSPSLGEFVMTLFEERPHLRDLCARMINADDTEAATILSEFVNTQLH